jgi:hypothetical protein
MTLFITCLECDNPVIAVLQILCRKIQILTLSACCFLNLSNGNLINNNAVLVNEEGD